MRVVRAELLHEEGYLNNAQRPTSSNLESRQPQAQSGASKGFAKHAAHFDVTNNFEMMRGLTDFSKLSN